MRAAVLPAQGADLDLVDLPDPEPAPGELLLEVEACGICGSDLHAAVHLPLDGTVFGHEFCGVVRELGPGVDGFSLGERVTAMSLATCGTRVACRSGRVRKCLSASMIGIERPGAYAELATVPAHNVVRLPASLDARHGALVEPLAVALHTVDRAGLRPGDDAVVLGGGPVGQAVVLWLAALGARNIVVSDPVAHRRELAGILGATHTVDPTTEDVAAAVVAACGAPPRVVIECVGIPGLAQHATEVAAVDGTVVIAGVCMEADPLVPFIAMSKELDVRFAFYYRAQDYTHTVAMLEQRRIDPLPMVTGEVSLDDTPGAFAALHRPTTECKVLIRP
ncbi:MAG: alcohol dehydrogenase catalytic domain-containing protein [Acidimicrobiia bacterium]|nr:alcohol dehydrogenase catalytic domain-containing protein [Acidimicrobiia bacterium]